MKRRWDAAPPSKVNPTSLGFGEPSPSRSPERAAPKRKMASIWDDPKEPEGGDSPEPQQNSSIADFLPSPERDEKPAKVSRWGQKPKEPEESQEQDSGERRRPSIAEFLRSPEREPVQVFAPPVPIPPQMRAAPAQQKRPGSSRCLGTVRWYNGRRRLGSVMSDRGGKDIFVTKEGTASGTMAPGPPGPGGLFHGTRVTFIPVSLNGPGDDGQLVCTDLRPCPGQHGLSAGVETSKGAKEFNEDKVCALDLPELGFMAGVFDGHRGAGCAEFVAAQLPKAVLKHYQLEAKRRGSVVKMTQDQEIATIKAAIAGAFEAVDEAYLVQAKRKKLGDGSTGCIAIVSHGYEIQPEEEFPPTVRTAPKGVAKLFLAWCGDCRAILIRKRGAMRLTDDHRPDRPDEANRCKKAGGMVVKDIMGVWRVGPQENDKLAKEFQGDTGKKAKKIDMRWFLSTSRSFGDLQLKEPDKIITATPEQKTINLTEDDWAVCLCSDGVYDALTNQEVADAIYEITVTRRGDCVQAAKEIVARAYHRGSRDNLTAFVLRLGWAMPPLPGSSIGVDVMAEPSSETPADDMFGGAAASTKKEDGGIFVDD